MRKTNAMMKMTAWYLVLFSTMTNSSIQVGRVVLYPPPVD